MADPISGSAPRPSASGIGSYQTPPDEEEQRPPFGVGPNGEVHVRSTPNPVVIDPPPSSAPWEGIGPGDPGVNSGGGGGGGGQAVIPGPMVVGPDQPEPQRPPAPPIKTGLGAEVDEIVNKSPHLKQLWADAQRNGWKIQLTSDGKSHADKESGTIFINLNDVKTKGDGRDAAIASLLSHEMGHAGTPFPPDMRGRDREDYVQKNTEQALRHEGEAALANLIARDEIKSNGGPDIGVRGGLDEFYDDVYNRFKSGELTREQAVQLLAEFMAAEPDADYGANKRELLEIYYGNKWDDTHSID
jgi:hypothetical protein